MSSYYDDLFKLCGWEEEEIAQKRDRIEIALERLGVGPEDMEPSERWIRQNHDVTLRGVRLALGHLLRECMTMMFAREDGKKILYFTFPAILGPAVLLEASSQGEIYCSCPDMILCHVMGHIFNKVDSLLEAGEANGIPPGHGLCSLWQVKVGGFVKGIIPPPDLEMSPSYFCDIGSKGDDFLASRYGYPVAFVDGSMDSAWGEYPNYDLERVKYLGSQIDEFFAKAREVFGIEITTEAMMEMVTFMGGQLEKIDRFSKTLFAADPQPVSAAEFALAVVPPFATTGESVKRNFEIIDILADEVEERIEHGIGIVEKGAPKVSVFINGVADATVVHMIEDAGLSIGSFFYTVPRPELGVPALDSIGEMCAEAELSWGVFHSMFALVKRADETKELLEHPIDGHIVNFQYNCRPLMIWSHSVKKYVEEHSGLPVLSIENDIYDTRSYSASALRTKVETFAEMLKARNAGQA